MVRYSNLRGDLVYWLECLSSPAFQERRWRPWPPDIDPENPNLIDTFDEMIHFLFDDTELSTPEKVLGVILEDEEEVLAIRTLIRHLDDAIQHHNDSPADSLDHDSWPSVVTAAAHAKKLISSKKA